MITHLKTIPTKDAAGKPNGVCVPIWHVDSGVKVDQVYLTTIAPGGVKGPHEHRVRSGAFTVIFGNVLIVTRRGGEYSEHVCEAEYGKFCTVHVPPGTACAIYNMTCMREAILLNMPSPPWRDNSDEFTPENWEYIPALPWLAAGVAK